MNHSSEFELPTKVLRMLEHKSVAMDATEYRDIAGTMVDYMRVEEPATLLKMMPRLHPVAGELAENVLFERTGRLIYGERARRDDAKKQTDALLDRLNPGAFRG